MFHNVDLKSLSELELAVYNYIISHPKSIQTLTIRELAQKAAVSTGTISRFCQKLNLNGFSELKYVVRDELSDEQHVYPSYDINTPLTDFFTKVSRDEFEIKLNEWVALILAAKTTVFMGIGSSGALANYGARFLTNAGGLAFALTDPFQQGFRRQYDLSDVAVVCLSVSGETEQVLKQVTNLKAHGAKIIAVTNHGHSPLASLADLVISYYMPDQNTGDHVNLTTQVPVVYLLETLTKRFVQATRSDEA